MKYELKQKKSENGLALIFCLIGVAMFIVGRLIDEAPLLSFGGLFAFAGVVFIVYNSIKNSGEQLFFDENSFSIGEKRYLYSQIERIKATNFRGYVTFSIYVNNEKIFTFDNTYENVNEFQRVLILNNVYFNPYGD